MGKRWIVPHNFAAWQGEVLSGSAQIHRALSIAIEPSRRVP
jgi:hypothetical protein